MQTDIMSLLMGGVQPPQNPTQDAKPAPAKSGWESVFSNPATQAGLLSMGLQLMTPTWGNPWAAGIGAGAEGATRQQEAQRAETLAGGDSGITPYQQAQLEQEDRKITSAENIAGANRTSRERIAAGKKPSSAGGASIYRATLGMYKPQLDMLALTGDQEAYDTMLAQAHADAQGRMDAWEAQSGVSNSQISPSAGGPVGTTGGNGTAPAANVGPSGTGAGVATPTTQAEYDALPSGTQYNYNGKTYTKK